MLLIDAGNSRCKWAWVEHGHWQRQGALDNVDAAAWDGLKAQFSAWPAPRQIVISNVAGAQIAEKLRAACAHWACAPEFVVAQAEQCGVRNNYAVPAQLGSDRWAALLAAWRCRHAACLVVNCGTATTVDALSADGEFLGGLILPGIALMQRSLAGNTAQLGETARPGALREFPCDTADAIFSGALRASAGAIRQQQEIMAARYGAVACLMSGGAAAPLLPLLAGEVVQADDLVLQGLFIIGQKCAMNTEGNAVKK